ncbi:MAG: PKD domain-containing protein, partial [Gammaproteobacteria bacterium]|nr:PKD domain-containing protein [Gammaproteobacteria bacterium]
MNDSETFTWLVSDIVAVATATPDTGNAPLMVSFDGTGSTTTGSITSYSWDFGDGNTSTDSQPDHEYTSNGVYTATLTVTDDLGGTDDTSLIINVTLNNPPILAPISDQSNYEGDTIDFTISASDPDGDTLTYSATGLPAGLSIDSSSGQVSGTLIAAGSYSVEITVSDGALNDSETFTWLVSDIVAVATATPDTGNA